MESIAQIINGQNGIPTLILVVIIVAQVFWALRKGGISYSGHGLNIGRTRENELRIIREQLQYMESVADATINDIPEELRQGDKYYRSKYVIGKYKDSLERMIIYNHLTKDEVYVKLKSEEAYNIVMKLTDNPFFKTEQFKDYMMKLTKQLIYGLVDVRTTYENMK